MLEKKKRGREKKEEKLQMRSWEVEREIRRNLDSKPEHLIANNLLLMMLMLLLNVELFRLVSNIFIKFGLTDCPHWCDSFVFCTWWSRQKFTLLYRMVHGYNCYYYVTATFTITITSKIAITIATITTITITVSQP